MNSAQARGLSGLAQGIQSIDNNDKDMAYGQMLSESVKQDQAAQEQAQIQEQQYYELLNKSADGLLSSDRKRIIEKGLSLQRAVKEQLKVAGGDRKQFLRNGGHNLLKGYTDSILNSEEMAIYKENKANLVKIMDAKEKGLGGQLLQSDIDSMILHQQTGKGKITYSGLLAAIDIPDDKNYDLGADIPIDDIIDNGSNYMKLVANYKMFRPDDKDVSRDDIRAFVKKMGYGGKGSNRDKMDYLMKADLINRQKKEASIPKDTRKDNVIVMAKNVLNQFPNDKTVASLYGDYENDPGNLNWFKTNAKSNSSIRAIGAQDWNHQAQGRNLNEVGPDMSSDSGLLNAVGIGQAYGALQGLTNSYFKPVHSMELFSDKKLQIAQQTFGVEPDPDGLIQIEPDETMYRTDGAALTGKEKLEPGVYKGKYKVLGLMTGALAENKDGKKQILMEVTDSDGNLDKTETKRYVDQIGESTSKASTFIAVQNDKGDIFYKEVPIDSQYGGNVLSNAFGEDADVTDINQSEQKTSEINTASEATVQASQDAIRQNLVRTSQALEQLPAFSMESEEYADKEDPSLNRSGIMKSFYQTISDFSNGSPIPSVEQNAFTRNINQGGMETRTAFLDNRSNLSPEKLINLWLKNTNIGESKEVQQTNAEFARRWLDNQKNFDDMHNE